eukprot:scaffold129910_cov19-Prasinocladus_malaysianus.AAC.1
MRIIEIQQMGKHPDTPHEEIGRGSKGWTAMAEPAGLKSISAGIGAYIHEISQNHRMKHVALRDASCEIYPICASWQSLSRATVPYNLAFASDCHKWVSTSPYSGNPRHRRGCVSLDGGQNAQHQQTPRYDRLIRQNLVSMQAFATEAMSPT